METVANKYEKTFNEQKKALKQNETPFSLSKDNQNRELSKQQQEHFKNSKAVDYRSRNTGFKDFKRNENFYTDDKNIVEAYSGSQIVDTRKLESILDAKSLLKDISEDLFIY